MPIALDAGLILNPNSTSSLRSSDYSMAGLTNRLWWGLPHLIIVVKAEIMEEGSGWVWIKKSR